MILDDPHICFKPLPLEKTYQMSAKVDWIGIRPEKKGEVVSKDSVMIDLENGIIGDHDTQAHRKVTIISREHLEEVSATLGMDGIDPVLARRNILISGLDFSNLENSVVTLGESQLEITGPCRPCNQMDTNLGEGGRIAMANKGGWTAKVLKAGKVKVGDSVKVGSL